MERADFLARIIEATQRLAAVPRASGKDETEWESALIASGAEEAFHANYDIADEPNVVRFLAFSEDNPSSIRNCIEYARTNARAVRTASRRKCGTRSTAPGSICRISMARATRP